ncbi:MAG: transposase [Pseudonocardia sp.]
MMDIVVERCAGLDVHRDTVVATVRIPPDTSGRKCRGQHTQTFATTTAGITALGDWLAEHRVTRAGMESTGVYWKPVYYLLEDQLEVWLINAEHLHNVPGRKTDVADSAWIAQMVEHGLVRPSFVPPPPIRALRDLTRHRRTLVEERTRVVQRLEKVMQDAGIKLTSVASALLTKSGRAMLEALLAGQTDPDILAELARGRLRSKIPALREALAGRFRTEHHGLLVAQMLAHIDFLETAIAELDTSLDKATAPFQAMLKRVCTIPGVSVRTAIMLLAECGADMTVFHTAAHLASWAGICPGNNTSGGKSRTGRTRHGSVALRTALTEAAHAAARTKGTYLAAHHAHIRGRRGQPKAIGATRHDLLIAYWHVVHDNADYADLGPDWAQRRRSSEYRTRRLLHQLEQLGHTVTIGPAT